MHQGFVKLFRKFDEWKWRDKPEMVSLFIYFITNASHRAYSWHDITVNPGQLIIGRLSLSEKLGISEQSIRTCITKLKSTNEITSKSTNKFTLITLNNWSSYQSEIEESTSKSTSTLTNNQPTTNQQLTTYKNVLELKEEIHIRKNPKYPYKPETFPEGLIPPDEKGKPKSYEAVINRFKTLGCPNPESYAKEFLIRMTSVGWKDGSNRDIKDWFTYSMIWKRNQDRYNPQPQEQTDEDWQIAQLSKIPEHSPFDQEPN